MKSGLPRYLWVVVVALLSGCALQGAPQVQLTGPDPGEEVVCDIAVLPFADETGQQTAAVRAYRIFTGEMIAAGSYRVAPEGEVRLFMNHKRLMAGTLFDTPLYAELGRQLGVDAVVSGRVLGLGERRGRQGPVPYCELQVDLVAADSGQLLARTYHRGHGEAYQKVLHFGTIRTTSGLLAQLSREIITAWHEKGLNQCSEE